FRGVDTALRGNAVGAARAVLETETFHVVTQFGERGGRRRAREPGADDDYLELPFVGRVDQFHFEAVLVPLLRERSGRNVGVESHVRHLPKLKIQSSKPKGNSRLQTPKADRQHVEV